MQLLMSVVAPSESTEKVQYRILTTTGGFGGLKHPSLGNHMHGMVYPNAVVLSLGAELDAPADWVGCSRQFSRVLDTR
jgi:hypothetical protein